MNNLLLEMLPWAPSYQLPVRLALPRSSTNIRIARLPQEFERPQSPVVWQRIGQAIPSIPLLHLDWVWWSKVLFPAPGEDRISFQDWQVRSFFPRLTLVYLAFCAAQHRRRAWDCKPTQHLAKPFLCLQTTRFLSRYKYYLITGLYMGRVYDECKVSSQNEWTPRSCSSFFTTTSNTIPCWMTLHSRRCRLCWGCWTQTRWPTSTLHSPSLFPRWTFEPSCQLALLHRPEKYMYI